MTLYSESLGEGPDLIILHGLFGSGDNWRTIARGLESDYRVHLLDLPNHGRSPWTDKQGYPEFADAVVDWANQQAIQGFHLMGHSMGGKVAMQMALTGHAERINRLIIVDIAPRVYPPHHQDIFRALNQTDLGQHKDRRSVDEALQDGIETTGIRQFILKSLYRDDAGQLAWRFNLKAIEGQYEDIAKAPEFEHPFDNASLFIKGMNSQYITAKDRDAITERFPRAEAKLIEGAGHWPHAEKPRAFLRLVEQFLAG